MIDQKQLELRVRAQIQGGKDLEGVAKTIGKIGDAIDEQSAAAKRGENRIDELKATLESLNLVGKELKSFDTLAATFAKLTKGVETSQERLASATKRYADYKTKLEAAEKVTDKQQVTLIGYKKALDAASLSVENQKRSLSTIKAEFEKAGIAVADLAAMQAKSNALQGDIGLVYQRGSVAVKGYAEAVRQARTAQAEQQAQLKATADAAAQFERAEQRALAAAQQRAKAYEDLQGVRSNRNAERATQQRIDAEVAAANKRKVELDALRKDITDRSAQSAIDQQAIAAAAALKKQADGAAQSAREYTTLARAADNLKPKIGSLRDTIAAVLNPDVKARSTLSGLESEVTGLANAIAKVKGPVQDYKGTVDRLNEAQRALQAQSGMIDTFTRQMVAVRQARAEFVTARADVTRYAAEIAKGGDSAQQFVSKLAQAESRLKSASTTLGQQITVARTQRDALNSAGITTSRLADAQGRLVAVARQSVEALKSLSTATERYGQSTESVRKSQGLFRDEGRTTLSYMQRLRGEVLSLAAAYGGLFTIINTAKGAVRAGVTRDTLRNQLGISVGNDRAAIDEEYNYVKAQSDRIGLEFDRAAKGYAKFSASATLAGRARQEIRYIWEAFAEVGRVANLSADDMDGVFKALEQITSKGKLQAEELRGQLGDRLFGAFQIAAKALKDEFPNLDKAMEKGEVTADQLIKIAEQYRKTVGEQLPGATAGLVAQQARLNNAIYDFQLAVADSGFLESYGAAVRKITEFLKSDNGKDTADKIGKLFMGLAEVLIILLDNIELVKIAFAAFATNAIVGQIQVLATRFGFVTAAIKTMVVWINTAIASSAVLRTTLIALGSALAVVAAAFAGWKIGEYASEKFEGVRIAGVALVSGLLQLWAAIKASFAATMDALPAFARDAFQAVVNWVLQGAKKMTGIFADVAASLGADELAASLRAAESKMMAFVKFGGESGVEVISRYRKELAKEQKEISDIMFDILEQQNKVAAGAGTGGASPTAVPGSANSKKPPGGQSAGELAKKAAEVEAIQRAIEAIEAKVDRSQTESLASQLEAIDTQYAALSRRIEKLGGDTGKAFMGALTKAINDLRQTTIDKFNKGLLDQQDALLKKTEGAEAAAGKKQKDELESRLDAVRTEYASLYRDLAELRTLYEQNNRDTGELDGMAERIRSAEQLRIRAETEKFNSEQVDKREKSINDTLAVREKLVAGVNALRSAGSIDDEDAAQRINAINDEYTPKLLANIEATREWANTTNGLFTNEESKSIFLATLDAIESKVRGVKTEFTLLQSTIIAGGVSLINQSLETVADSFGKIITGQQSVAEGFKGMISGFAQFAAAFLKDIALMIIKMAIFKALQNSGNPYLQAVGAAGQASMGVKHGGGLIGHYGEGNRTRSVDTAWFANAPRYHTGGIPGLKSDEYATILQKNEEVLAADSPRNIMNGGAGIGQNTQTGGDGMRVVLVDDRKSVPEAMSGAEGDRVVIQSVRRQLPTIKAMLK